MLVVHVSTLFFFLEELETFTHCKSCVPLAVFIHWSFLVCIKEKWTASMNNRRKLF